MSGLSNEDREALAELLWSRIEVVASECWEWTGYVNSDGYGRVSFRGENHFVHRLAHLVFVGEIPVGLHIDHLCRNRRCANPAHIEAVESRVNTLRGVGPTAANAMKSACQYGHPFTAENTRVSTDGERVCRACCRIRMRKYRLRRASSPT